MNPNPSPGRTGGFTLIELLLVIGIVGLLAVAFLPDLFTTNQAAEGADTSARMQHLKAGVDSFERQYAFYPPDDLVGGDFDGLVVEATADSVNPGIESLILFTHQKRGGTNLLEQEQWLENTDGDKNKTEIPLLKRKEKMEVVDAWGTPIAYFVGPYEGKRQQIGIPGGGVITVEPWKNPRSSGYLGDDNKYMLISAGPDGVFNTEDDLTWPERPVD
jgi:prepilin-type N-terminal cleavage/methylation domain-containing protein